MMPCLCPQAVAACLIAAAVSCPTTAAAQARTAATSHPVATRNAVDLVSRLALRIPELMEEAAIPGAQIAILRNGVPAWAGAFGVVSASTRAAVTDASVFEAASLSKPVFAYAVLKLVDAGRLDLDKPLVAYLPGRYDVENDDRLKLVTARHVLSHRTGFPNWRPRGQPLKLHFTPGERFSYSGEGFVYLAAAVERLTGQTLQAFVKRSVFDPLGMASSSYVWEERFEASKAYSHDIVGGVAGRNTPWRANAAASLHTTATDYARFLSAVIRGIGLRPATAREMLTPQSRLDERGIDTATVEPTGRVVDSLAWGLGWGLEADGHRWTAWHWGDNGPTKAYVWASPVRGDGMVVFLNSENGLAIVPAILTEVRGVPGSAIAWLKEPPLVPAFGQFVRALRERGAADALSEYRATRKARPADPALGEGTVNSIGYVLLRNRKVKDAVAVFAQNVEDHPDSWNAHDSLGEAYAADGDVPSAIRAYERSLQLNPDNTGGAAALKKLRAQGTTR